MIHPICEAKMVEEARNILSIMKEENLRPTIETYLAFLHGDDFEGTLEVLNLIKVTGLGPTDNTFLLVLGKFFKMEQPNHALKIWEVLTCLLFLLIKLVYIYKKFINKRKGRK